MCITISKMISKFILLFIILFQTSKCVFSKELARAAILNGKLAKLGQFPYVVYISNEPTVPKDKVWGWLCTGAILTEVWVVTGAHCYSSYADYKIELDQVTTTVTAGTVDAYYLSSTAQVRTSTHHVRMKPNWRRSDKEYTLFNNDVLVLKVTEPFLFNKNVAFVTVAKRPLPPGKKLNCIAVGFGVTEAPNSKNKGQTNYKLYYTDATLDGDELSCQKRAKRIGDHNPQYWQEENVCMDPVDYRSTPCYGDSGGPLMCGGLDIGTSIGRRNLYNERDNCGSRGNYHVYTFLGFYEDWLREHIPELPPFKEMKVSTRAKGVIIPRSRSSSSGCDIRFRVADFALVVFFNFILFHLGSRVI